MPDTGPHTLVIDSGRKFWNLELKELYRFRDLLTTLAYRDLKVLYTQSFLGFAWVFLQPVATLLIFVLIFGKALKVDTGGLPYALYAMAGMVAWRYFAQVLTSSGQSVLSAQGMVKKIYFPRLVLPLSKALVSLVDFGVSIVLYIALMLYYKAWPGPEIAWLPVFLAIAMMAALTAGIWTSALTIRYRDIKHIIPFVVQIGLYATPVAYPARLVPDNYLWLYNLNPMVGVVEGFRWCLVGGETPGPELTYACVLIGILFMAGLFYFKNMERVMPDLV